MSPRPDPKTREIVVGSGITTGLEAVLRIAQLHGERTDKGYTVYAQEYGLPSDLYPERIELRVVFAHLGSQHPYLCTVDRVDQIDNRWQPRLVIMPMHRGERIFTATAQREGAAAAQYALDEIDELHGLGLATIVKISALHESAPMEIPGDVLRLTISSQTRILSQPPMEGYARTVELRYTLKAERPPHVYWVNHIRVLCLDTGDGWWAYRALIKLGERNAVLNPTTGEWSEEVHLFM